jgi:predicted hotdog family 3-hydroxylacyl-ACP dehydratase
MIGRLHVNAIGFAAPGIDCAAALFAHFGGAGWVGAEGWTPSSARLSRRQALRLSEATRLAIMVAEQIGEAVPREAAWVFASSTGEGETLNEILTALCQPEIMLQPLRFQNSVHNAAQGQWSIIAGATGPATSIAAYDHSVGAGLLKAMMQAVLENTPVGLVVFDAPMPPPIHEKRRFGLPMAAALALSPEPAPESRCALDIEVIPHATPSDPATMTAASGLLGSGNPVRFILPLLEAMHRPDGQAVVLALPGGAGLKVTIVPRPMPHEALARMPHAGPMQLLDRIVSADAGEILCIVRNHRGASYPLRLDGVLHACALVELGAQAAAAHMSLFGIGGAHTGLVLALSNVEVLVDRVADDAPLTVRAEQRQAFDDAARYHFAVMDRAATLVAGDVLLSLQRRMP